MLGTGNMLVVLSCRSHIVMAGLTTPQYFGMIGFNIVQYRKGRARGRMTGLAPLRRQDMIERLSACTTPVVTLQAVSIQLRVQLHKTNLTRPTRPLFRMTHITRLAGRNMIWWHPLGNNTVVATITCTNNKFMINKANRTPELSAVTSLALIFTQDMTESLSLCVYTIVTNKTAVNDPVMGEGRWAPGKTRLVTGIAFIDRRNMRRCFSLGKAIVVTKTTGLRYF